MRLIHLALAAVIALAVPPAVRAESQVPRSQGEMRLSFAPVVKRTAPAVVNVYAQRIVASRAGKASSTIRSSAASSATTAASAGRASGCRIRWAQA